MIKLINNDNYDKCINCRKALIMLRTQQNKEVPK